METVSEDTFRSAFKSYFLLTKPGIIFGNSVTALGGFLLASRGRLDILVLLATLIGLGMIVGSGCVLNNYIDRSADGKMKRTKKRPLVKGEITPYQALAYAMILGMLGTGLLAFYVNPLSAFIALCGFVIYVLFYSFLKYRSWHATLVGSLAGAVPPAVGYCAVSNRVDGGALIIFMIVAMWQMPHFFAISIYRIKEYAAASIPVLPIARGIGLTKAYMLFYILGFMLSCYLLTLFNYTNSGFMLISGILGSVWLWVCIQGFRSKTESAWARKMFVLSLVIVMAICFAIPFTTI